MLGKENVGIGKKVSVFRTLGLKKIFKCLQKVVGEHQGKMNSSPTSVSS